MVTSIPSHSKGKNPRQNDPQFLKNSYSIPTQEKSVPKKQGIYTVVNYYQFSRPSLSKENEQNKETYLRVTQIIKETGNTYPKKKQNQNPLIFRKM